MRKPIAHALQNNTMCGGTSLPERNMADISAARKGWKGCLHQVRDAVACNTVEHVHEIELLYNHERHL